MCRVTVIALALCALMLQAPLAHAGNDSSGTGHGVVHGNSNSWATPRERLPAPVYRMRLSHIVLPSRHAPTSSGVTLARTWALRHQETRHPSVPIHWLGGIRAERFPGIDHRVRYDNRGIWKRSVQKDLINAMLATVIGGSLALGDHGKLGDTFWRSLDAVTVSAAAAQVMKWTFQRERPSQTNDPGKFFQGFKDESFPSGEVTVVSAAVTPFIIRYGREHPAVYALAALPLYDAMARVKTHGHWQTDVIAGAALGTLIGVWATDRQHSLLVSWLPGGFSVGYVHRF